MTHFMLYTAALMEDVRCQAKKAEKKYMMSFGLSGAEDDAAGQTISKER